MGETPYDANTTYLVFTPDYAFYGYETVVDVNRNVYTLDNTFPYNATSNPFYTYSNNSKNLNNIDFNWAVEPVGPYSKPPLPPFNNNFTKVILGENVTTIIDYAFRSCEQLSSVTIPDSVTSIGEFAFYSNNLLTTISVGNGVISIGSYAFMYIARNSPNDLTLNYGTEYVYNYFYTNITNNGYNNSLYTVNITYNPPYPSTSPPVTDVAGGTTTNPKIKATYSIKFYKSTTEIDTSESAKGSATGTGDTQLLAFEDVNNTVTTNIHDLILALETAPGFDDSVIPTSTKIEIDYTFL